MIAILAHFGPHFGAQNWLFFGYVLVIFGVIFWTSFWTLFGALLDQFWDPFLGPNGPKKGQDGLQEAS